MADKNKQLKQDDNAPAIVIKQTTRFGKPVIHGTRVAVTDILSLLQSGYRISEIPEQYPGITARDAEAALQYTAKVLGKEEIFGIEG